MIEHFKSQLGASTVLTVLLWAVVVAILTAIWKGLTEFLEQMAHWEGAPVFIPFSAGHLPMNRGDAFGVVISDENQIPKAQSYVGIQIGMEKHLFKLKGVETLSTLGPKGTLRSPEVYLVVDELLDDEMIRKVNSHSGFVSPTGQQLPPVPRRGRVGT